jgi:hypothetical protein
VPSQDDYYSNSDAYGNPRNYYGNHNARFAMGKGKGKGKSFNTKGIRNAIPKEWDADQLVIPEFGAAQGIAFYTINNLLTEGMSTYVVRNLTSFVRSITPGHPIEYLDNRQMRFG